MKKLITIMAAAASALFAFGDVTLPSGTSLEGLTVGEQLDPTTASDDAGTGTFSTYWFLAGDSQADLLVTNYVDAPYTPRPEQFSGDNNKYLRIETSGRLYRSIGANDQTAVTNFSAASIGNGIYLDTLVQFTPAEDAFGAEAISAGDKIAIEYVEREDDPSTELVNEACTNFVVRAAYVDAANSTLVPTNYFLTFPNQAANEVQFDKTAWHRLTVRAISDVGNTYAPVGFVVYVDGTNLVYGVDVPAGDETYVGSLNSVVKTYLYNENTHALLPSLVSSTYNDYDTLSAVAFNGNGSVDDISFTATKPGILPAEGTAVTIAWDANVASYTVVVGEDTLIDAEAVSGAGSTNLLLDTSVATITVTAEYATGYEAGTWTVTGSGASISGSTFTVAPGAQLDIVSMLPLFQVGETHYGTFAEALAAAVAASKATVPWTSVTIKALADIDEGISFTDGDIVLDLNGRTLQGTVEEFTINNSGAILTIIDSASGGTVVAPSGDASRGALYMDDGATVINGGRFEGYVITQKMDEDYGADDLTLNGGVFFDNLYNPGDEDSKFYLYDYLGTGVEATYNAGYFTVGSPIIGTYTVTVTPTANATYAAAYNDGGAAVEFVNDVAAVTVGKTITITATPGSGYEYASAPTGWTAGQDGEITIEVSAEATVAIPAPTAVSSSDLDPAGNTPVEIEAESEAAATNAVQLVTPSGVDPAAYKDLFDFTVTPVVPGVKYEVEIAGIKESVELAVEESAMDVLDGKLGAKVQVPAGLNYKITTYETLGGSAVNTTSGQSDGTGVSVSKPGDTQGFIKIEMATVPFN